MEYLEIVNSLPIYLIVGAVLLFIALFCLFFIVKSFKAGLKIGMDRKILVKAITSSASFTILPSVSILLGVIALSGSLGVPAAWLRLSVVGNLQYEATVAEIAAQNMGVALNSATLTVSNLVTIILVMTVGIMWGCVLCLFTLKPYSKRVTIQSGGSSGGTFATWAMTAMMIGLCATFIGSYIAKGVVYKNATPVVTLLTSGVFMALFEFVSKKVERAKWLDSFSLALSMLCGMAAAVLMEAL